MGNKKKHFTVMLTVFVTAAAWAVFAASASAAPRSPVPPTEPGGTWGEAQYPAGISTGENGDIKSVSCTSPGNCSAVGYQNTFTSVQPIVVDEIAGTWGTVQEMPGIASLETGGYAWPDGGISCASAGNCGTGGSYLTASRHQVAFLVDETNGTWGQAQDVTGVASPGNSAFSDVTSISCAAAENCTAVGDYEPSSTQPLVGFIVTQTDGTWGPAQVIPGLASLGLSSTASQLKVVCSAAGYCTVAGEANGGIFAVSETAGTWGNGEVIGHGSLMAFSCSSAGSAGSCAAGGYYTGASNASVAFVIDETNGTWHNEQDVQGLAALATGKMAFVTAISCPAPGDCAATGYFWVTDGTLVGVEPFVVDETDSSWGSAQVIPGTTFASPGNGPNGSGYAISCVAPGDCAAGGNYTDPGDSVAGVGFVVNETDGVWGTAQPVVRHDSIIFGVESLSCTAPGYCGAGGDGAWVMNEATATTTQLTISTTNLAYGDEQADSLSATVTSPAGGTPTGTVTVGTDGAMGCTITLTGGSGSCTPSAFSIPAGSDNLFATYNGDTNYTMSSSAPTAVTVTKAASATSLTLSRAAVTYGNEATEQLTAAVTSPTGGSPTGKVTVVAGSTTVCTITLTSGTGTSGTGTCTPSATSLLAGGYQLTAAYSGDTNYTSSGSAQSPLTVTRATSKTSLTLARSIITYGQETTEHLSVTVTPQFAGIPTGKVTLKAGTTTICVLTLNTTGKGTCTLTARQLAAGTYTLTAAYGGSANYHSSTSLGKTLKVLK